MMQNVPEKMPRRVLCVCLGNICRSPTAEEVLRQACAQARLPIDVDSAGTADYHVGDPPDPRTIKHARQQGYRLDHLRARQVTLDDFAAFDVILAMDEQNLQHLQRLQQYYVQKTGLHPAAQCILMSAIDPLYPAQAVPDPYYGDAKDFERVIAQCESSARAWVAHWQKRA